ncbi:MAG: PAS domain-containing protein [Fibrobacteres bacterium]|nr:PAS domain-containing protein [Fibrobacterota bacterium]
MEQQNRPSEAAFISEQAHEDNRIISEAQVRMLHAEKPDDVYHLVAAAVHEILGDAIVAVSALNDDGDSMQFVAVKGLNESMEKVISILGIDPTKTTKPVSVMSENELKHYRSGSLEKVEDGFFGLLTGFVPKLVCDGLQKLLRVNDVYTIGFIQDRIHLGGLFILSRKDIEPHRQSIEELVRRTALIVQRDRAKLELIKGNQQLQLALSAANAGTWSWDIIRNTFNWSAEFLRIFGMPPATKPGFEAWSAALHPDDREIAAKRIQDAIDTNKELLNDYRIIHPDGKVRHIRALGRTFYEDSKPVRMTGLCMDITESKQVEISAKESNENFRSLFIEMKSGCSLQEIIFDDNGNPVDYVTIDMNPAAEQMLQIKKEIVIGKPISTLLPPEEFAKWLTLFGKVVTTGKPDKYLQYSPHNNKTFEGQAFCYKKGMFATTFEDISDRQRAEKELVEANERFALATSSGRLGVWDWNLIDNIMTWDDRMFEIYGINRNTFPNNIDGWTNGLHPDDKQRAIDECNAALAGEREFNTTFRIIQPNGNILQIKANGMVIRNKENKPIRMIGINSDQTESRRAEDAMQKAEKLQSIGILAGGIAHDFNNLLQSVFGFMDMIKFAIDRGDLVRCSQLHSKAVPVLERAQSLTQQLLTYSKGGIPVRALHRIDTLISETVTFVLSGSNITHKLNIASDLRPCYIDAHQITQVIDNIIINARQAMPLGGSIEISAENISADTVPIKQAKGHYIRITFKDHGMGIAPEHLPHIFIPFFTTKNTGSGLGLATCYSIISKHNGHIEAESELGKGTIFHLYLPAVDTIIEEQPLKPKQFTKFNGKILLMDDEEPLRDAMGELLKEMGFTVSCAVDADEAVTYVKQAKETGEPFKFAILDLTIPGGRGGKEVVRELLAIDDSLQAIASSGYAEDHVLSNPKSFGFKCGIAKPYNAAKLEETLKKLY